MRIPHRFTAALVAVSGVGLLAAAAPAAADTTVTLSSCSSGWSINGNVFSCLTTSPPTTGGPTNCFVSPVNLPVGGGSFMLTGSCGGTAATGWSWNGAAGGNTYSGSATASTTVQATPFNGSVAGNSINVPITVGTPPPPPGGGGGIPGGISCSPKGTVVLPMNWPASGTSIRSLSTNVGVFGNNTVLVSTFTTGSKNGLGRLSTAEYASGPELRTATLSASPCGGGALSARVGVGVTMYFSIGSNTYGYPVLQPNTTYYFNVENAYDGGTPSCPDGSSCDVSVDLKAP